LAIDCPSAPPTPRPYALSLHDALPDLQVQALVGQVPEVLVLGVVGLPVDAQRDVVGLGVVDLLVPALDVPFPPGGDDGHVGSQGDRKSTRLKSTHVSSAYAVYVSKKQT